MARKNKNNVKSVLSLLLKFDKIAVFIFDYTIGLILKDKELRKHVGNIIIDFSTGNLRSGYFKSYRLISDSKMRKVLLIEFKKLGKDTVEIVELIYKLIGAKINVVYEKVLKEFGIHIFEGAKFIIVQIKQGGKKSAQFIIKPERKLMIYLQKPVKKQQASYIMQAKKRTHHYLQEQTG